MTPILLFPLGLVTLAALTIPLILHLRRRTQEVPVDFAALRWLDPRPRPRRKVRVDDWPLLITRLLLIALLALLLARPAVHGWVDDRPRLLVSPGVDARSIAAAPDADVRWLSPGFPSVDTPFLAGAVPLASLIRQGDAELPPGTPLTVVVPEVMGGADADRLRLTRPVRWQVAPGAVPRAEAAAATPFLDVRQPAGSTAGLRYFRAVAQAWSPSEPRITVASDDASPVTGRTLIWLKPGALPVAIGRWIETGGTALLAANTRAAMPGATQPIWRDEAGLTLIEDAPLGRGRILRLTRPLTPSAMPQLLDPDFPDRLRSALVPAPPAPDRVLARAYAPAVGAAPYPLPPRDVSLWVAMAIALLFLVERWLATGRRRRAAG